MGEGEGEGECRVEVRVRVRSGFRSRFGFGLRLGLTCGRRLQVRGVDGAEGQEEDTRAEQHADEVVVQGGRAWGRVPCAEAVLGLCTRNLRYSWWQAPITSRLHAITTSRPRAHHVTAAGAPMSDEVSLWL